MKILFLGAHFPRPNNPTMGVWALAQVWALREAGHEVHVVSPVAAIPSIIAKISGRGSSATCPPQHNWDGIETDYLRWPVYPVGPLARALRNRPDLWVVLAWHLSSRRFLRIAREFRPDVILAHHGQFGGLIASRISHKLRVPFFVTEHSFGEVGSCASNSHRRNFYSGMLKGVGQWIAVAKRMEQDMRAIFPNVPITTIHNGGDPIPPDMKRTPRPTDLEGCLVVLTACFFYKRKRVPNLIESFDAIAHRHPNARLLVIGSGDDQVAVTNAAAAAKHASQIVLCGHKSHDDVLQYTSWCDVFVNIAVNEPFGTTFSDAMMAGKPIIFASDCGITDVAENGKHGLSVEPDNSLSASEAIDKLLEDGALRARLGAAAEFLAKTKLSWSTNAARYTALFQSAVH